MKLLRLEFYISISNSRNYQKKKWPLFSLCTCINEPRCLFYIFIFQFSPAHHCSDRYAYRYPNWVISSGKNSCADCCANTNSVSNITRILTFFTHIMTPLAIPPSLFKFEQRIRFLNLLSNII